MRPGNQGPYRRHRAHGQQERVTPQTDCLTTLEEAVQVIDDVLSQMGEQQYSETARQLVRQALEEAVLVALTEKERRGPGWRLQTQYQVSAEYVLVEVEGRAELGASAALQGPHGRAGGNCSLRWSRSYAWLRCDRCDGYLQQCRYWSVP